MHHIRSLIERTAGRFVPGFAPPIRCVSCGRGRDAGVRLISGPAMFACECCLMAELVSMSDGVVSRACCDWCRAPRLARQLRSLGATAICTACLDYARAAFDDPDHSGTTAASPEG